MSTDMTLSETSERWSEGLRKAASRCRELGRAQSKEIVWNQIASSLDQLRENGEKMIMTKALSRTAVLASLDEYSKKLGSA